MCKKFNFEANTYENFHTLGIRTIMHHGEKKWVVGFSTKCVWSFVILIDDKWHIFWEKWLNIHQKGERKSIFIKFQTIHYSTKIKRRLALSKYFQKKTLELKSRHIQFEILHHNLNHFQKWVVLESYFQIISDIL